MYKPRDQRRAFNWRSRTLQPEHKGSFSCGIGFRVLELGFRVLCVGSRFRILGVGFRVLGVGFRVLGLGFKDVSSRMENQKE